MTSVETENDPGRRNKLPHPAVLVALGLVVVLISAIAVAAFLTSKPAFFARYKALTRRYDTLQTSVHRDLACNDCHTDKARAGGPRGRPHRRLLHEPVLGGPRACLHQDGEAPADGVPEVPQGRLELGLKADSEGSAPRPPACEHREARMRHVPQVDGARRSVHGEAQDDAVLGVCATYGCHAGWKSAEQCSTCHHTLLDDKAAWTKDHPKAVQAIGPNACLETCHDAAQCRLCHTTGKVPVFTGLAAQTGLSAIETQHAKKDWMEQHGTLALADKAKCLVCHVSEGECDDCHALRSEVPRVDDHLDRRAQEPGKQKERCLACHKEAQCTECHDQFKEMR